MTIGLCLLLLGVSSACTGTGDRTDESPSETANILRYDVNAPFGSLHPLNFKPSGSNHTFRFLYSSLFYPLPGGELAPDLAVTWLFHPAMAMWTIRLRTDARFHDGRPVTAGDVKFSLESYIDSFANNLNLIIDRIATPSDDVLLIHLRQNAYLDVMDLWDILIVPHDTGKSRRLDDTPIGSGPFRFVSRKNHQQVILSANSDYYGGPSVLEQIVFNYQPDKEKNWLRMLQGKTDIAQEISPLNFQITCEYAQRFYFDTYTLPFISTLLFNTHDPLFTDPKVRKAIALGIDCEHIVARILEGYGRVATGPLGVDSPFADSGLQPLPYAPDRAREMLRQTGWVADDSGWLHKDGKPFAFTLFIFEEGQIDKETGRFIQLYMGNLGIKVRLSVLPHKELIGRYFRNDQFQAVLTEFNCAYFGMIYFQEIWSPGNNKNASAGCFFHPEVNELMELAVSTINSTEKKSVLRQLERLIVTLQPGVFLFQKTALDAMSRRFILPHPFALDTPSLPRLRFAKIDETFHP